MGAAAQVQETLELVKKALKAPSDALSKSITTDTGLVAYDLQAPSKNLYPVNTPLRNRINRVGGGTGKATNWNVVSAINGSGYDTMGWVPEGQRSGTMSYTTALKSASYVTLGEEDKVTYEARNAGQGYEDVQATMVMRLLQKAMLKEENGILGGNASLALGTTPTPTTGASGAGGTLPTLTYDVACIALTYEGYRNLLAAGSLAAPVSALSSQVITGADAQTFTLNSGAAQKSAVATQAITLGQNLTATVTQVRGAVAYAWFIGAAGVSRLEAITTINSLSFSTALLGTGVLLSAITAADYSRNQSLAFDGLLTTTFNAGNNAYFKALPTGTAGTGTALTASGRGSINEIDTMLRALWDQFQVSPTVIFVNSQELLNITAKVLTNGSGPLLQYFADPQKGAQVIAAGGGIEFYFNPFGMGGGFKIPIMIHPFVPAGTIIGWCENLPLQYQSNNVPNVAEVHTRADYYQINWPITTRAQGVGVYMEEVLAVYAPFAMAVITNIANG